MCVCVPALVKGAGRSVQFRQLQLYKHEMQHFVKVIQGYIANQILQVSWSEFKTKMATVNDLDAIHRTHADYLNRAIFRYRESMHTWPTACFNRGLLDRRDAQITCTGSDSWRNLHVLSFSSPSFPLFYLPSPSCQIGRASCRERV